MSVRRKIYANLEGRIYGINLGCTLTGLDLDEGRNELHKMIGEGLIIEEKFQGLPLYRLSFRGRDQATGKIRMVVDNGPKVA